MNGIPGYVDPYTASIAIAAYGSISKLQSEKNDKSVEARIKKLNEDRKKKVNPSEPGRVSCYA